MGTRSGRLACSLALAGGVWAAGGPPPAHASGLYFSERGVRPLARGGAFIAGADDLGAMWHNPAGLYDAKSQFLIDLSWLNYTTDYQRRALVEQRDPNTGQVVSTFEQTFPAVQGTTPVVPLPTLGFGYQVHEDWVVVLGAMAPYAALASYPQTVDGEPSPSRYSLITLDGSALLVTGAWAGWRPHPQWRVGFGLELLVGTFVTTQVFNACLPDRFFCAREQPSWDSLTQLTAGPIVTPSGNAGVIFTPTPQWRIGAALQAPFFIDAPATLRTRMPATPVFESAYQDGIDAGVSFQLPLAVRLGVEYRPLDDLRIEVAGTYDAWSMHDEIVVEPENIKLRDVVGFPDPYLLPTVTVPRGFRDTASVRAGAEYTFEAAGLGWTGRGGASYESSAIPDAYVAPLSLDIPKVTLALGAAVRVDRFRFDLVYAHVFGATVDVDPAEARVPLLSPVQPSPNTPEHYINGGSYRARANVLGVGLAVDIDSVLVPPPEPLPAAESAPAPAEGGA